MRPHTKAFLALAFISLAWGTTYYAIRVGAAHYPPFIYAAIRQLCAGAVLLLIGYKKKWRFSWKEMRHHALVGFLLITMGNGVVTWGEQEVPSGVAALICAIMPAIAVVINLAISKTEKLNLLIAAGLLLGLAGVGVIFKNNINDLSNPHYLVRILGIFLATICWAGGSVLNKHRGTQETPVFNSGLQLFFGGLLLLPASLLFDNYTTAEWHSREAFWSLIYLIIIGSVLAYSAYMYALRQLPTGIVMTYAYINPLVAVVLAYFLNDGNVTLLTGVSFLLITLGVWLVNKGYRRQRMV